MAFNPKSTGAIKEKQKLGIIPKNPMNPQNIIHQIPNLVPPSPIKENPMSPATMPIQRFGKLKQKLGAK